MELINKAIIKPIDLNNRDVYFGYDTSLSNDDTSLVALIPYQDTVGNNRFYVWQHSFIPTRVAGGIEAKQKLDGINYQQAEEEGFATVTKSRFGTIDQDAVYNYMLDAVEKYHWNVKFFGFDRRLSNGFIKALNAYKSEWLLVPIAQGALSLSQPTKFLQDAFNEGTIKIPDDRVLKAGLSNAILTDRNNELLVDKNKNSSKIDMVDALIDACFEGMYHYTDFSNVQEEKNDKNPFEGMNSDDINKFYLENSVV